MGGSPSHVLETASGDSAGAPQLGGSEGGTRKVRYYESLGSEGVGPERDGQRQGVGRRRRSRAVQTQARLRGLVFELKGEFCSKDECADSFRGR